MGRSVLHVCTLRVRVNAAPSPPGQRRLQSPPHSRSLRSCSFLSSPGKVQYAMRTCAHSCAFQMWPPGTGRRRLLPSNTGGTLVSLREGQ